MQNYALSNCTCNGILITTSGKPIGNAKSNHLGAQGPFKGALQLDYISKFALLGYLSGFWFQILTAITSRFILDFPMKLEQFGTCEWPNRN